MTDRTDHYLAAERMLDDANVWAAQAGELSPEASERACLAWAQVHALLAIHDTLAAADRYAANEAKQREAGADPLDEDDHRDRVDRDGDIWQRAHEGCWMEPGFPPLFHGPAECVPLAALPGPLTFAPEPPPDGAGADLTASEGESGSVEGEGADDAPEALLCSECGHDLEDHCEYCCGCTRSPSGVAYALIERAVNIERTRMAAQLRQVISSAQDSGDLAELDALADEWEASTDG